MSDGKLAFAKYWADTFRAFGVGFVTLAWFSAWFDKAEILSHASEVVVVGLLGMSFLILGSVITLYNHQ